MREILFRGKRTDNREWVEGAFLQSDDECRIATSYLRESDEKDPIITAAYIVDPKTVGQYTGLPDKNKNKIFEGDIIRVFDDSTGYLIAIVKFCEYDNPFGADDLGGHIGFCLEFQKNADALRKDMLYWYKNKNMEVIGNIFDNPELLSHDSK